MHAAPLKYTKPELCGSGLKKTRAWKLGDKVAAEGTGVSPRIYMKHTVEVADLRMGQGRFRTTC